MNQDLAFRDSGGFAASGRIRNHPRISSDGTALFLDACRFDEVDRFILDVESITSLDINELKHLLWNIKEHQTQYENSNRSSLRALSRAILSGTIEDSTEFSLNAAKWLCHTLTSAVAQQLCIKRTREVINGPRRKDYPELTNDEYVNSFSLYYGDTQNDLNDLVRLLEEVRAKHPQEPWPTDLNPVAIDCALHAKAMRHIVQQCDEADRE